MTGVTVKQSRLKKPTLKTDLFDDIRKDEIKAKVDIVSLFAHFGVTLSKKGKSFTACCPWHDDSSPSLSVDREKGLYNCFGCGESGDVVTLVEKMKGLSFSEAMLYLKEFAKMPEQYRSTEVESKETDALKIEDVLPEAEDITPLQTISQKTQQQTQPSLNGVVSLNTEAEASNETEATSIQHQSTEISQSQISLTHTLDAVADYYHSTFLGSKEAQEYLKSRGIATQLIAQFRVGYCDGTLKDKISSEQFIQLQNAGIFSEKGYEHFKGCIVIPLPDRDNHTLSFYGRRVEPVTEPRRSDRMPQHLYLSGQHKAIFNEKALVVYDQIILTESVIDALSLISVGVQNVSCIYGTNGLTKLHTAKLHEHTVKEVVLAFDNDDPGLMAAEKNREILINEGFAIREICPKGKDWNEDLCNGNLTKEIIDNLIVAAAPVIPPQNTHGRSFRKTDEGLQLTHDEITYTVKSESGNYKQSIRCNFEEEVYYDRVDLYSARSRASFAASVSRLFDIPAKQIEKDLIALLEYLEHEKETALATTKEEIVLTEEEKVIGMQFLTNPNMFDEIIADTEVLGYVGEEVNKKLMYLAATSRLLDDPISILILSESGSGKSFLVDTIKKLMPPEDVIDATSLSDQALNYIGDLEHKFLVLSEAVHKDVVEHQLREMVSAKKLSRLVTKKDEKTGKMKTEQVSSKAIVSVVMSSTNHNVNPENASRSFIIYADESKEQSRRIYQMQSQKLSLERHKEKSQSIPEIIRKHQSAQRMLKNYAIVSSFDTAPFFPDTMTRFRRDHERFIDLIATVCFLRQYQKQVKEHEGILYIECDDADYEIARELISAGVLRAKTNELPQGALLMYETIRKIARKKADKSGLEAHEVSLTQREIRDESALGNMFVKRHLRILTEYEYVLKSGGNLRGSRSHYRLAADADIHQFACNIPPVEELQRKQRKEIIKAGQVGQSGSTRF